MSIVRVAQAANVSYATAWRIINNHPCGSQRAVAAVKEAISRLGYEPTAARKRGRRPKAPDGIRTRNIALLHFRQATSISASVLSCVHRMLSERNLNLIFAHCTTPEELPYAVRSGNIDGILGYGTFPAEALDKALQRVPAVWMMSRNDRGQDVWGDRVKPDHETIGHLAASHLIARGHDHLAFLNPEQGFNIYQQRCNAFRSMVESAGKQFAAHSSSGSQDFNVVAEKLVEQWMAATPRATGIFVPVDRVTLFVYRHLELRGIAPGRDVDIVSCDNEKELLSLMHPQPPSIDLNREMIARLAVERLLWRMKNGVSSPSVVTTVSPTLVAQPASAADAAIATVN
ncbi:MAG: LacI family transcriptional regulator, purine nucleotide synthesis repressor [Humisphaera sp.]|nr:LacI family transcriptional regulator, purine nucleotide synthesis repressor [Humisphaera sp.]